MYNFYWFWSEFSFTFAFFIATLLVAWRMPKRSLFWLRSFVALVVLIIYLFLFRYITFPLDENNIYCYSFILLSTYVIQYFLMLVALPFLFECSFWTSLFCVNAGYSIQHMSQRTYQVFETCYFQNKPYEIWIPFLCGCTILFYVAYYFFFVKKINYLLFGDLSDHKTQLLLTLAVLIVSVYLNAIILRFAKGSQNYLGVITIVIVLSILMSLFILMVEFSLVKAQKSDEEIKKLNNLLNDERIQYEQEKATMDLLNVKYHDIKHLLNTFQGEQSRILLPEIKKSLSLYESISKTGNEALDLVLSKKANYCHNHNIRFTWMIDGTRFLKLEPYEAFTLFGNSLNNAIHAAEQCEGDKRTISISQYINGRKYQLSISNYFIGQISIKNGLPVTKERNVEYHGFGVRSIQMIAEKYGGKLHIDIKKDLFTLVLSFPA